MSWFQLALIIHILGVLALVAALALQLTALGVLRTAKTVEHVRLAGSIFRRLPPLFGSGTALIILSGIYMMIRLHSYGWTVVALVAVVVMAVLGSNLGRRSGQALAAELQRSGDVMTADLKRLAASNHLLQDALSGLWLVAALVVVMIVQPAVWASIVILVVAIAIGLAMAARFGHGQHVSGPVQHGKAA